MARVSKMIALACSALGVSCGGTAVRFSEDSSALVQGAVRAHSHQAASAQVGLSKAELLEGIASQQMPSLPPFDCSAFPKLCEAPFNCQTFNPAKFAAEMFAKRGMAGHGEANFQAWCTAPMYQEYIHTCIVEKDLLKAAKIQYQWSLDQHSGVDEMDGSYCFIEGHCSNTAVTNETTLEESYKMCDDRYGHKGWAMFGSLSSVPTIVDAMNTLPKDSYSGFREAKHTKVFLKAACAMGNYHCDVVYCKETYCKNPYYIQKYRHLQPAAPGHLLQSKDFLID